MGSEYDIARSFCNEERPSRVLSEPSCQASCSLFTLNSEWMC